MNKAMYCALDRHLRGHTSRRDFIQAIGACGLGTLAADSLLAFAQRGTPGEPVTRDTSPFHMAEGTAGGLLVAQLRAAGVKHLFHTNTSGLETVLDALVDTPDMHLMLVPHEGQAVAAAHGYAAASGELGVFVGSRVGVGNTISNLYNAWKDRTPIIIGHARTPLKQQGGQDTNEEWDSHLHPTEPFTAWHWSCVDAETMPEMLRRGIKFAISPPGAPVTLDFPEDLLRTKIRAPIYELDPRKSRPVFRASPDLVNRAAEWLASAENPLFVVGGEVTRGDAQKAVRALAEKLSVPVFQAVYESLYADFPTDHPLFLGDYLIPSRFPESIDLLVNIGARFTRRIAPPGGARIIHISSDMEGLGRIFPTDLPILADVPTTVAELSDAIDGMIAKDRLARIQSARLARVTAFTQGLRRSRELALRASFDDVPLSWERVGYELERVLDRNAVLVPEIGSHKGIVFNQLRCGGEDKARIGRTTGQALGWGIPAAFGVQLAVPDRQVVSLQGDGGFLFGQSDSLWSMSRYDAPVLIVVMNNRSYNETRSRNMGSGGRQYQTAKDMSSYLGNPDIDFTKLAEAYRIRSERVADPKDLGPALQRAVKTMRDGRPVLLDLDVGRDGLFSESTWYPPFSVAGHRSTM